MVFQCFAAYTFSVENGLLNHRKTGYFLEIAEVEIVDSVESARFVEEGAWFQLSLAEMMCTEPWHLNRNGVAIRAV